MTDPVLESLIVQLVQWISEGAQTYETVMSAWRTSCPRLPVWEEANERGLIGTEELDGRSLVGITPSGIDFLKRNAPGVTG